MSLSETDPFGELIEPYRPEIQAHCYRMMGTIQDAEDMTQEAFLRAWLRRETFAGRGTLRAWLYKIATNVCLDTLKQRPRRWVPVTRSAASTTAEPIPAAVTEPVWLEPYPDDLLVQDEHTPEEHYMARETVTLAFIAALHLLPPRQRAVVILRDALDWQTSEVAALLDSTESAVKSALHRARSTLAGCGLEAQTAWMLDDETQARLNGYVRVWETADINGLVDLLREDATFSMPPIPSWYRGKPAVRELVSMTIFSGQAYGRWRLLPTRANRQPAFGLYRQADEPGTYNAYGIQVLTLQGSLVSDITTFRNPALFPHFKLPPALCSPPA